MNAKDLKENCRLFYMVKGHLNVSIDTINKSAPGYFARLWNNNEAYLKEEGFQEVFDQFIADNEKILGEIIAQHIINKTSKKK